MKLVVVSCMKLAKIMKPSSFGQEKKMKLTARGFWWFHNFMPVSLHETINQFHFLEAKKSENHSDIFWPVSRETVPQ